jgi:hypothetical protein
VDGQAVDVAVLDFSAFLSTDLTLTGGQHGLVLSDDSYVGLENCVLGPSTGVGLWTTSGSEAFVETCEVQGRTAIGMGGTGNSDFTGADSRLILYDVHIADTLRRDDLKLATGMAVTGGAHGRFEDSLVENTEGNGLVVEGDGRFTVRNSVVQDSLLAGLFVANGAGADLTDSIVRGVGTEAASGLAMGVFVGSSDGSGATLVIDGSTVSEGGHAGVWVESGKLTVRDSSVSGGDEIELLPDVFGYGHAVYAADSEVHVNDSALVDAGGAGLFLHASTASVGDVEFSDNRIDVQVQACLDDWEPPEGLLVEVCPEYDDPVLQMTFYGVVDLGGL